MSRQSNLTTVSFLSLSSNRNIMGKRKRKRDYQYCILNMSVEAPLSVVDSKGTKRKWSRSWMDSRYGRLSIKSENKYVVVSGHSSECRETLCNDWSSFFQGITIPDKSRVSTRLPRGTSSAATLNFYIDNGYFVDDYYYDEDRKISAYVNRFTELILEDKRQRELILLMDVLLGCIGMLIDGPKAFVRRKANPLNKPNKIRRYSGQESGRNLAYNGLSNFCIRHPAVLSLMMGLGRTCIDFYAEGKFPRISKHVKLKEQHKRLVALSKKKEFGAPDRAVLSLILSKFRNYFYTQKVREFPGFYPLNPHTWTMFTQRLLKEPLRDEELVKNWGVTGPYGVTNGGFYQWCQGHKKQTAAFKKRKKLNWG